MDKSSASSQSQKPSTGRRERVIPSTPRSETMTPPTPQSMVLPTINTSWPPETSKGKMYLEILRNALGKFSPTGKMSEVFAHLATKFKEEEEQPSPIPIGIPADTTLQAETFAGQPLTEQVTSQTTSPAEDPAKIYDHNEKEGNSLEEKGSGEGGDENAQEPVVEQSEEKELEVVDVDEEDGSNSDAETLDERAKRRSLRIARNEEMVEVKGKLVESAVKAVE